MNTPFSNRVSLYGVYELLEKYGGCRWYASFFNGYYGPAAKVVRQYFDELQALSRPDDCVLSCYASMTAKWYSDEFFHPKFSYNGRKKGLGQIAPKTSDVEDGYQWYDVATWSPDENQTVWIGPGRFDMKGGKASAVRAVFVDRFEFVKVE